MVRKIACEIEGSCPLLHHRMANDRKTTDRMSQLIDVLKKNPYDEDAYTEEGEYYLYKNKDGKPCIPANHIIRSMVKAGPQEKIKGQGKKTYKDSMNAFVIIDPELIEIDPCNYELDRTYVKVSRSRVLRTRPKFQTGWTAKFTMIILDDTIPFNVIEKILKYAGGYVGIGDWRPKYGRFKVNKLEEIKN